MVEAVRVRVGAPLAQSTSSKRLIGVEVPTPTLLSIKLIFAVLTPLVIRSLVVTASEPL